MPQLRISTQMGRSDWKVSRLDESAVPQRADIVKDTVFQTPKHEYVFWLNAEQGKPVFKHGVYATKACGWDRANGLSRVGVWTISETVSLSYMHRYIRRFLYTYLHDTTRNVTFNFVHTRCVPAPVWHIQFTCESVVAGAPKSLAVLCTPGRCSSVLRMMRRIGGGSAANVVNRHKAAGFKPSGGALVLATLAAV